MNKIRVLGKLISKEKLEQYTGDVNKIPVYYKERQYNDNQYQVVVVIEPVSDLPEEFEKVKYFNCNSEFIKQEYVKMNLKDVEEDVNSKYISFVPKKIDFYDSYATKANSTYYAYDPQIITEIQSDTDRKFIPLPYFDLDDLKISIEEFENKILNGQIINIVPEISYDVCQGMCIVKKSKNKLSLQGSDIFVYLNIENITNIGNGITIHINSNKIKKFTIAPDEYDKEIIILDKWVDSKTKQKSNVVFVDVDKVTEWDNKASDKSEYVEYTENLIEGKITNEIYDTKNLQEKNIIKCLQQNAVTLGLLYDKKDLINFHIAIKSSGLVILSGMSGTGKSKLINLYAKTLGLGDRFKMIPVSPAWTDDTDLLGYLDYRNMVYRPADTDLVNFLIAAEKKPDELYMICFDEMNLARVEHYFSQFISVLENNDSERYIQLYNSNLKERVYNSNIYPPKVLIRKNVIFVGTVNIDESTFHFSDKVLDRASVIKLHMHSFVELKEVRNSKNSDKIESIYFTTNEFFSNANVDAPFVLLNRELEFLNELNILLKINNPRMGIGYRIINQINQYLAAIPENSDYSRQEAFDNLVTQRILTKIRGADDQILKLIGKINGENMLEESSLNSLFDKYSDISEFMFSKNVLIQKAKELKLYGYTI